MAHGRKVLISVFRGVSASAGRSFHFGGGPGRWAIIPWGLDNFLIFPNFLGSLDFFFLCGHKGPPRGENAVGSLDLGCLATREATGTYCVCK